MEFFIYVNGILVFEIFSRSTLDIPYRFFYYLKADCYYPYTQNYLEELYRENCEGYYKAIGVYIGVIITSYTCWVVPSRSTTFKKFFPSIWYLKLNLNPYGTIHKYKSLLFFRVYFQKMFSSDTLNMYAPVIWWPNISPIFILTCILGRNSQLVDFSN